MTNFYGESTSLFVNLGQGLFADRTAAAGLRVSSRYVLGFGACFLDANNDGLLDLATANGHVNDYRPAIPYAMRSQLFLGIAGGRLAEVGKSAARAGNYPTSAAGWPPVISITTANSTCSSSPKESPWRIFTIKARRAISSR